MAKKKEIVWAPLLEITSKEPTFQVRFSPKQRLNLIKNSRKGTNLGDIQRDHKVIQDRVSTRRRRVSKLTLWGYKKGESNKMQL